ncbi:unnamed protein product [Mytilus coruscus]|uniref:RNase H type-1 domain-containing protein n=1 Tax=Mytilus coruscus TaxID=42192 RepID=A0A6J8E1F7_MYTCO|nr:unnamed protein product [Mytilus coruscus]
MDDENTMSDIEKVKAWAAAKKLSEATAAAILTLGFDSLEAVSLISPEDLNKSKIPIGQIKMLMRAVRPWKYYNTSMVRQTFVTSDAEQLAGNNPEAEQAQPIQDGGPATSINIEQTIQDGGPSTSGVNITQPETIRAGILNNSDSYVQEVLGQFRNQQQQGPSTGAIQVAILLCYSVTIYPGKTPRFTSNHWEISKRQLIFMTLLISLRRKLVNDLHLDKDFLLQSIESGFDIVDQEDLPDNILAKNHPSALPGSPLYEKAHLQILNEIDCGNYVLANTSPRIISPMGVIPKPDGGVRLIHDCSRPEGSAVNDFVSQFEKQRFQTIDDAAKLVSKIFYMRVEIDSSTMELRLPADKLSLLRQELDDFKIRKRASKKQLQSLAGKLNWASAVIRGGRVFLRRIIDCITTLKRDWHKILLKSEVSADIAWRCKFMAKFNGKSLLLDKLAITSVCTDACRVGGGGFYHNDWFYANWEFDYPFATCLHINELEAFSVILAAIRWAKQWQNKRVIIFSDNMVTVNCINKGTSKNKTLMSYLRRLFWLSSRFNFHVVAMHVQGKDNILADSISRLHETPAFVYFLRDCLPAPLLLTHLREHMSNKALSFLLSRHVKTQ